MKKLSKNYKYILGLVLLLLAGSGCKKDYLQLTPPASQTPENIFATTKNAMATINGIHRVMYVQWYGRQSEGGLSGHFLYMEVLGEDFVMTAQANGWFVSEYRWLAHRNENATMLRYSYGFFYSIIGNCNMIIANIDNAVGPEEERRLIKGQAYAYRAWAYFNLVQMFGERYDKNGPNNTPGVSLVLEPRTGSLPRNTVAEVYDQINQDIDEAIRILDGITRPHKSHIDVNVAKGIKARIALTQQDWENAAKYAREARQGYPLMTREDYMKGFTDINNREWIWGIRHRDDHPTYFYSFYAYLGDFSSTNTRGNPKAIFAPLYNRISPTDIRKQLWDPTGADPEFPVVDGGTRFPYMTRKFRLANPGNSNGDLVFMRAAEMYLIEAEALARIGGEREEEAKDVLYELAVARDPDYTRSTNTGEDLIDEILFQRRVELWAEGFRFLDLKRLNMPLDRTGGNHDNSLAQKMTEPAGTKNWVFLIPRQEIEYTLGVVQQNPL